MLKEYISHIQKQVETWSYTEHTFRPALINLLEKLQPNMIAQNETERLQWVWMPDITIIDRENKDIKKGWIECKDLEVDLSYKKNQNQLDRYLWAFENFIYTNNLQFDFYRNWKRVDSVKIGSIKNWKLVIEQDSLISNNFEKLEFLLKDFLNFGWQTIKSPQALASAMSRNAKKIAYVIENILKDKNDEKILKDQFLSMKKLLIHDLDEKSFADMYSQTLVYGLFVARLHDKTLDNFSRQEAQKLIPKSNPFLRWLFQQLANDEEFDDRISYIIDDLINIFNYSNVSEILNKSWWKDPIIHFYEDFLSQYNWDTRKSRWVYYTPKPVVDFIIKNVDLILKQKFSISSGLADTEKLQSWLHRVQVLDPATWTGTFLNGLIEYIYENNFSFMKGQWQEYVKNDLLPRIFGFELMMASYSMCHLRLFLTLKNLGFEDENERIWVYLTNSLEKPTDDEQSFFARQLAQESKEANKIKSTQPIMVVLWNPPYAVSSSNKGEWIQKLIQDYKKDLGEKKINLDDDYIKFIRFAQYQIDKTWEWILAFITNNSYLDWVTHRQMRKTLMESFDEIYIVDLHWNAKKKEKSPDWSKDENVFDIMQWVSIIFWVKKLGENKECKVYHYDLYWTRKSKFEWLENNDIWKLEKLEPKEPYYFFVPKDLNLLSIYNSYNYLWEIFKNYSSGIESQKDEVAIQNSLNQIQRVKIDFQTLTEVELRKKYNVQDWRDWMIKTAKEDILNNKSHICKVFYKPFDLKYTIYTGKLRGFLARPRNLSIHFIKWENISLNLMRTTVNSREYSTVFVTNSVIDKNFYWFQSYFFPLNIYIENINWEEKFSNINYEILPENLKQKAPEEILHYVYWILYHRWYREKYNEFLKIDFPRIPLDVNQENFEKIKDFWKQLIDLHLMENISPSISWVNFPNSWSWIVEKVSYNDEKVFINPEQYFENVPKISRDFFIGGYQPAQKYLKDRKWKKLTSDEIMHYMKIIYVLKKTDEIMSELEKIEF